MRPLAIDLFTGLHGWADGLIEAGFRVIGYDIEDMSAKHGHPKPDHFELVLQDVLTLHGSQFKDAELIVASPPCQEYSYMAMPWSRAKAIAAEYRSGKRDVKKLTALFDACFRIQREASEAAGRHIPMVVENVRGAQPWVGRAAWNFGSYYLWGDVPALMPIAMKRIGDSVKAGDRNIAAAKGGHVWTHSFDDSLKLPGNNSPRRWDEREVQRLCDATKTVGHMNKRDGHSHTRHLTNQDEHGTKQPGIGGVRNNGKGDARFQDGAAQHGSKSNARKAASAKIAKIPFTLAHWIGRTYLPKQHT